MTRFRSGIHLTIATVYEYSKKDKKNKQVVKEYWHI
jgi:hypothetical protein